MKSEDFLKILLEKIPPFLFYLNKQKVENKSIVKQTLSV